MEMDEIGEEVIRELVYYRDMLQVIFVLEGLILCNMCKLIIVASVMFVFLIIPMTFVYAYYYLLHASARLIHFYSHSRGGSTTLNIKDLASTQQDLNFPHLLVLQTL